MLSSVSLQQAYYFQQRKSSAQPRSSPESIFEPIACVLFIIDVGRRAKSSVGRAPVHRAARHSRHSFYPPCLLGGSNRSVAPSRPISGCSFAPHELLGLIRSPGRPLPPDTPHNLRAKCPASFRRPGGSWPRLVKLLRRRQFDLSACAMLSQSAPGTSSSAKTTPAGSVCVPSSLRRSSSDCEPSPRPPSAAKTARRARRDTFHATIL